MIVLQLIAFHKCEKKQKQTENNTEIKCDSSLKVCKIGIYYCFGNVPLSKSLPITPMVLNYNEALCQKMILHLNC